MKIAVLSDLHITESRLDGGEGHTQILKRALTMIQDAKPDLVLVGGDLTGFEVPHRATPRERNALVEFLVALGEKAPVVICRGNHDYPGDFEFLNLLRGDIIYSTKPELVSGESWAVMTMPWLDITDFPSGRDYTSCVAQAYRDATESVKSDLLEVRRHKGFTCVLGHMAVAGASFMAGLMPLVPVADPVLNLRELIDGKLFDAVFLGHYHGHQRLEESTVPTWYVGSLFSNVHGDSYPKGWLYYSSDTGSARLNPVSQPTRFSIHVRAPFGPHEEVTRDPETPAGSKESPHDHFSVSVEGGTSEDALRAANRHVSALKARGAVNVKLSVRPDRVERAREGADEVAKAGSIQEKVAGYFAGLEPRPPKPEVTRALEILTELSTAPKREEVAA